MTPESEILEKLRHIAGALPAVAEARSFGHPCFQVKKRTFAVYENQPAVHGTRILAIKATLEKQAELVARGGFSPCKFAGKKGWTYVDLDRALGRAEWQEIATLMKESHQLLARPASTRRIAAAG